MFLAVYICCILIVCIASTVVIMNIKNDRDIDDKALSCIMGIFFGVLWPLSLPLLAIFLISYICVFIPSIHIDKYIKRRKATK